MFVIREKAKGSHTILLIINQSDNYRRIRTFSQYKDCKEVFALFTQFKANSHRDNIA